MGGGGGGGGGGYLFLPEFSSMYDAIHGWMTEWRDGWTGHVMKKASQKTTTTSFIICIYCIQPVIIQLICLGCQVGSIPYHHPEHEYGIIMQGFDIRKNSPKIVKLM